MAVYAETVRCAATCQRSLQLTSVVHTTHAAAPATLIIQMKTYEKSLPYSSTSGCVCMSERIVKQQWKHQVNPTAKSHAQAHGSGDTNARVTSAASATSIV